jgi:hypothetical protein
MKSLITLLFLKVFVELIKSLIDFQAAEISHFKSAHNKFFVTDKLGYIGN